VLFSEPKIPQCFVFRRSALRPTSFSALQRAENSSILDIQKPAYAGVRGFSALQRAENSSIQPVCRNRCWYVMFQCSSASRKFLNSFATSSGNLSLVCFSALQRAENSSIRPQRCHRVG